MTMQVVNGGGARAEVHAPVRADLSIRFTPEQEEIILATCCGGASKAEANALLSIAEARGLNPILGECYFVKRWDNQTKSHKWAVQASIDSFRIKAEQTGLYAGQDEPEFEYDAHGNVKLARVRVYRKDWPRPAVGVARYEEYVQTTKEGDPTKFWKQMPHNQLAKCAEALAMRKAFPAVLSKIYTTDEMAQADNEVPLRVMPVEVDLIPQLQASVDSLRAFRDLCDRVDVAESVGQLNAVAAATGKSHKAKQITDAQLGAIKDAVTRKRALIGAPKPPKSDPRREPGDDSDLDDAREAEAEVIHAGSDE